MGTVIPSRYSRRLNGVAPGQQTLLLLAQFAIDKGLVCRVIRESFVDLCQGQIEFYRSLVDSQAVGAHRRHKLPNRHVTSTQRQVPPPGMRASDKIFML